MVREDIVNSAVSFLQDPSVAAAPLEQRVAFLRSKNLTQEEVDLSLARAGSDSPATTPSTSSSVTSNYAYQQPQYRQPPPAPYNGYPNGYWQPPPPPEPPKRDWRDLFIMATVMGGVGYGVYFVAKRYIVPLIAPPTPPQIEQDKESTDASFDKAFALIEQLSKDTEELKASEKSRTEKLDQSLSEVESVIGHLKDASKKRDDDAERIRDDIRALKDLIPRSINAEKENTDNRLKELNNEMKSLKALLNTRMNKPGPAPGAPTYSAPSPAPAAATPTNTNGASASTPVASEQANTTSGATGQTNGADGASQDGDAVRNLLSAQPPERSASSSPYSRFANGRAAIPAWQLQAKKNQDAHTSGNTSESGTAADAGSAS